MSRIAACLSALRTNNRKALIPYIVAGDPDSDTTVALMHQMVVDGADILEIGVPFSDPMAEGPVIQLAHERALAQNISLADVLLMVARFRATDQRTPIVLMGYLNPVECMGYATFATRAVEAGVDGLLTVDLPPEEAGPLNEELKKVELDSIFLIAPTTSLARIASIAAMATGYLYYVSLKGVTGAGNLDTAAVTDKLQLIRGLTELPISVGFGIKDAASARSIAAVADGVVVGSALVDRGAKLFAAKDSDAVKNVSALIAELRAAIDKG